MGAKSTPSWRSTSLESRERTSSDPPLEVGQLHRDAPVKPAGPQQGGVQAVGTVGGGQHHHALGAVKAVHLGEQLVQGLLPLVVAAGELAVTLFADGIDLVDENDAGGLLVGLLEQVPDLGRAPAHEHLHELRAGDGEEGDVCLTGVDFCVPTGNFGDILAGYYAKQMGLPVGKLICASNKNNVLTDFIKTGTYDARRTFYKTTSPSMDILISSNLERLLLHTSGSAEKVEGWMQELAATGKYTVDAETLAKIQASFAAGYADDAAGAAEIRARFERDGYLCDTHTAVAFHVAEANRSDAPMVVLSTASPFKFPRDVLAALGETAPESDFAAMAALTAKTGAAAPASLRELDKLPVRFNTVIEPAEIRAAALR